MQMRSGKQWAAMVRDLKNIQ